MDPSTERLYLPAKPTSSGDLASARQGVATIRDAIDSMIAAGLEPCHDGSHGDRSTCIRSWALDGTTITVSMMSEQDRRGDLLSIILGRDGLDAYEIEARHVPLVRRNAMAEDTLGQARILVDMAEGACTALDGRTDDESRRTDDAATLVMDAIAGAAWSLIDRVGTHAMRNDLDRLEMRARTPWAGATIDVVTNRLEPRRMDTEQREMTTVRRLPALVRVTADEEIVSLGPVEADARDEPMHRLRAAAAYDKIRRQGWDQTA